jgi:hypothetical protein
MDCKGSGFNNPLHHRGLQELREAGPAASLAPARSVRSQRIEAEAISGAGDAADAWRIEVRASDTSPAVRGEAHIRSRLARA